jgi:hypothetical protein
MWDLHLQKINVGDSCKLAYVSKWKLILNMNFLFCIFWGWLHQHVWNDDDDDP